MIEKTVARLLSDRSVVSYTPTATTGNAFLGELPPSPDLAVSFRSGSGPVGSALHAIDESPVQMIVRGEPDDYLTPRALAASIVDELSGLSALLVEDDARETYLIRVLVSGDPVDLGRDERERYRFSINAQIRYRRPVAGNRQT